MASLRLAGLPDKSIEINRPANCTAVTAERVAPGDTDGGDQTEGKSCTKGKGKVVLARSDTRDTRIKSCRDHPLRSPLDSRPAILFRLNAKSR